MPPKSRVLIKSKEVKSPDELADFLAELATVIRSGVLTMSQGYGEPVDVRLPPAVRVEVELKDSSKTRRNERELEIEISWQVDEHGEPLDDQPRGGGLRLG